MILKYKNYIKRVLAGAIMLLLSPLAIAQTSVTQMENGDTVFLDACALGGGIIYDNGGSTGNYGDSFDGWLVIEASTGITISMSGNYNTEPCCDHIWVYDGTTLVADNVSGTGMLDVTATSGRMLIHFTTDGSVNYNGFSFTWAASGISATCTNPVTNLDTTAVTTSSISLTWNATNTSGPFTIISNGVVAGTSNTNSYTMSGLNAATLYEITVTATSNIDNRCCASTIGVRTACGEPTMPYGEGFEWIDDGDFPKCWISSVNFDEEEFLPQVVASHRASGKRSLLLSCGNSDSPGHFGMVATPPLSGSGNHTMRVKMLTSHSGAVVMVGTCDSVGSDYNAYGFTLIQTIYLNNANDWEEFRINWNATSGRRLAFRMEQSQQNGIGRRVYLDDMSVEVCGVDSVQTFHIDYDHFSVSWSTYGSPSCTLGLRPDGAMVDSITINNAVSPYTFTGLGANRRYLVTVYPDCGASGNGISRSATARTSQLPTNAAIFCSDFYSRTSMPQTWTYHTANSDCGFSFEYSSIDNNYLRTHYTNVYDKQNYIVSERLFGLAGKQIAVEYGGGDYYDYNVITIGTLAYPDDTSSFVPLASDTIDGGTRHSLVATVPTTSTGSYIAIHYKAYYSDLWIYGVQSGVALVDSLQLLHRRGTSVEFSWAETYDTVLIQYGPRNFTLGTGTVDTFYNAKHGKVTGLTPSTLYDFYVYRPATAPCTDFRRPIRTATQDYPLPYCEDFSSLNDNSWYSYDYLYTSYGDWQKINSMYEYPRFYSQPYDGNAGNALQLSSWGFTWDYYSTALLPDVEVDSNSILSFYINDNAPNSTIIVGTYTEGYHDSYIQRFLPLDTIHINAQNHRVHVNYALRPSDTLFNRRIALRYIHPYEFSYYTCYIDELQIAHSTYSNFSCYATSYTTAGLSFGQLIGTDSAEVTITGGGTTIDTVLTLANIDSLNLTGLDTGTLYYCYVRPFGGCTSYAGYFITVANGFGNGNCFPFDNMLSYELPYQWAASGGTEVTADDHLQMEPSTAVATHPLVGIHNLSFSFRAKSAAMGDTLLVGIIPADSIHIDSTHFNFQSSIFTCFDTFVIDTAWRYYTMRLPDTDTDHVRMTFLTLGDTVSLDDIGWSWCPIVHFSVDGNTILCEMDADMATSYFLHIIDSTGEDDRVILVEQNPYRVEGLHLGHRYDLWWQCLNGEDYCRPIVSVHTENLVPLPYCEDFNVAGGTINIPHTWDFFLADPNDELRLETWGPSLLIQPAYSHLWEYAVLPPFDADSAMSLHAYFHDHWCSDQTQIGYLANGTDTGSFVPLWSADQNTCDLYPEIDLSPYTNKRIAIRTKGSLSIQYVHVYGAPLAKVSLVASRTLKVTTTVAKPYWLHFRDSWNTDQDTMFYVDTTVYHIYDSNFTYNNYVFMDQTDSTGYTCDNSKQYYLGEKWSLPYCHNAADGDYFNFNHGAGTNYIERNNDNWRAIRFYGDQSGWKVMPDFHIDSIKHAGMRVRFDAGSAYDTVVVGVLTDAYDTLSFTPVDTLFYTRDDDSIQTTFVDFSNYADTGRWITFHHLPRQNAQWFDIRYVYVESCPGALGATARLSRWNQVCIDSPKTPFYVEYFHTNESSQNNGNTILRIDSVPQILILDPETTYDFYFRCDSSGYTCVPAQRVTTLGAPLEVPSCTDFDTVPAGTMPRNWTRLNNSIAVSNTYAHSDTNSIALPIGVTSYLVSPDLNIDSIQKVAMSIWYRVDDMADRLVVGVMSDPYDLTTFYPIRTLAPIETGTWQHGYADFRNAPEDAHFIALRARSNRLPGGRSIYVDDIYVNDCAAFNFNVMALSNNSIDLSWSQIGNPNTSITVLDEDSVVNVYTNVTPPLHIEPLEVLHYYTFLFSSICSEDTTGYCNTNYFDTLSVITPEPGVGCVNATDLSSPQAVFYSGTYSNPYSQAGAINLGPLHPDSRHTVCYDTAQRDPRTGNQLRTIPEGYTSSVRLGNWNTNAYNPEAEGVIYGLYVDTNNFSILLLRYAAVLQDPLHAASDQPRFRLEVLDSNFNIVDPVCAAVDFVADQSLGWNTAADNVLWKDWTSVGIDMSAYADQQVYVRLTTFDCNEGSHYGYAYFTLECLRMQLHTDTCGAVDSNTFTAPAGFTYRWYTSDNPATYSTEQNITVAATPVTYFCELSSVGNSSCQFTVSVWGGSRYPMASFDTNVTIIDCQFHVDFQNTSFVSADDVVPMLVENKCESARWDLGNGTSTTDYNCSLVYPGPGTYTVTLISGISDDNCTDTATLTFTLDYPQGVIPSDTVDATICDNQTYTFHGQDFNTTGTHYSTDAIPGSFCDSVHVLHLTVNPTSTGDTSAVACDTFYWRGTPFSNHVSQPQTFNHQLASGVFNSYNCDSIITLHLTLYSSHDTTIVDTMVQNDLPYHVAGSSVDFSQLTPFNPQISTINAPFTTTTVDGCDSTVTLQLAVWVNRDTAFDTSVCNNLLPLIYHGEAISTATTRTVVIPTVHGADSSIAITLNIIANPAATIYDTTIENLLPRTWRGFTFNRTTDTTITVNNAVGCDSLINYKLQVWSNEHVRLVSDICEDTLPFTWFGHTFTDDDSVTYTLTSSHGADSTVTLVVYVHPNFSLEDTIIICPWRPFMYEGVDYGGPTSFNAPHPTVNGCDSLVHVVLMPRDSNYHPQVVYSTKDVSLLNADTIILGCAPDTLTLSDTSAASVAWLWSFADSDTTVADTTQEITINLTTPTFRQVTPPYYTLIVTDSLGCLDTVSQPVYIFRSPTADFDWEPNLPVISKPEAQFYNHSDPLDSLTFLWSIQSEPGGNSDTTSVVAPYYSWGDASGNTEGDYLVQLIAYWTQQAVDTTIVHTCPDTTEHTVTITNDYLQFPNLVTPNGDGVNDTWRIVNLLEYGIYSMNELWIFNEWGVEVYHVKNITRESDFWDPLATSSPDGTYFFRFTANSPYGIVKRNGTIEVLR